jgi:co-chaperonin GroES (HSP10)
MLQNDSKGAQVIEELILPANVRGNAIAAEAIKQEGQAGADARARLAEEGQKAKMLPVPTGYRVLVAIPTSEETFESGLLKADVTRMQEEVLTVVGFVISMGPDCYLDKAKFPTGPYCKVGDFVLLRTYSGTRFKIHGKEFRMINDDTVEAIVEDPRGVTRV